MNFSNPRSKYTTTCTIIRCLIARNKTPVQKQLKQLLKCGGVQLYKNDVNKSELHSWRMWWQIEWVKYILAFCSQYYVVSTTI
jgi:hypothetical protein